jgi:uncharacterized SAM-binding protein YcdF (DUF218 family)
MLSLNDLVIMHNNVQLLTSNIGIITTESNSITQILLPFILLMGFTDVYIGDFSTYLTERDYLTPIRKSLISQDTLLIILEKVQHDGLLQ